MATQLQNQTQKLVDTLLHSKEDVKRSKALREIVALPEKDQVAEYLLERLAKQDRWGKTWSLSALARIGTADGVKAVLDHIAEGAECDPWVRHFALLNAATFQPFPQDAVEQAVGDAGVLPKATALRLLLANGKDEVLPELLAMLADAATPDAPWAAARALRNRCDIVTMPLRPHIEDKFVAPLVKIVADTNSFADTRWEAVQTLASFQSAKSEIAKQLSDLLDSETDPTFRRYYVTALRTLRQAHESQAALLLALADEDAQIRLDAADALKEIVGGAKSIQLLLPHALNGATPTETCYLVDALRHIDVDLGAKALRDALSNPDDKVSNRANQLLTALGGQAAAQILITERTKALDKYTDILSDADKDVREHFNELMGQAKFAFWLSLGMHVVVFGIGVLILNASLSLALNQGLDKLSAWIGVGGAGASALVILLTAFYRNPLHNMRASLNALMQVDVVFLGYVRQVNQIDATFKHMYLDARDFGADQMKGTVAEIQKAVSESLGEIKRHLSGK